MTGGSLALCPLGVRTKAPSLAAVLPTSSSSLPRALGLLTRRATSSNANLKKGQQTLKYHYIPKNKGLQGKQNSGTFPFNKAELPLLGFDVRVICWGHEPTVQSKFTPCFSSFCLALPGRLKVLSCALGKPELRPAGASCWK